MQKNKEKKQAKLEASIQEEAAGEEVKRSARKKVTSKGRMKF